MKKILLALAVSLGFLLPTATHASVAVTWLATSTDSGYTQPAAVNGNNPFLKILSISTSTFSNGITLSNGCLSIGGNCVGGVTSVFGRTGAVVATLGDYTTSLVTEGTNLYFTTARVLATTLTGFSATTGTVTSSDTILTALEKLAGNGATYLTNITGLITNGTGIGLSGSGTSGSPYSISNTGVTSIVAGSNISISGATGAVTINSSGGGSTFGYPFPLTGNATSTLTQFNGGLTAFASSTIGDNTNGLTISGGATTTQDAYFNKLVGIGTTSPNSELGIQAIAGTSYPNNSLFQIGSSTAAATTTLLNVTNIGQLQLSNGSAGAPGLTFFGASNNFGLMESSGAIGFTASNAATLQESFQNASGLVFANPYGIYFTNNTSSLNTVDLGIKRFSANTLDVTTHETNGTAIPDGTLLLGTIGIGGAATTTPGALLSVAGTAGGTTPLFLISSSTSLFATTTIAEIDKNGNALFGLGGANVGIGTTTPGSLLSIGNTGGINFTLATSTFNTSGGINIASGCYAVAGVCVGSSGGDTNLTGAITSVGNATSLGSFSSANLAAALTDETGTGSAVFAGSPVLTGTATGVNLTLSGTLTLSALTGTQCLQEISGVVSATGSACGSGGGSSFAYPFTPSTDGGISTSATSTPLEFNGTSIVGFDISTAGASSGYGIGGQLLAYASSTNQDTIFGLGAGGQNATTSTTIDSNISIGYQAGESLTTGVQNMAIGSFALQMNITGNSNIAIGWKALQKNTAEDNLAMGDGTLFSNITGANNTAIGFNVLELATAGNNTAIGSAALSSETSGIGNTAIGENALQGETTGTGNTAIGLGSGDAGNGDYERNTFVGDFANENPSIPIVDTTGLGYEAGFNNTGWDSTFLGELAGQNIGAGNGDILIGYNALGTSTTATNFLNIGNTIFGLLTATSSSSTVIPTLTGMIGIGTTTPTAVFETVAASTTSGTIPSPYKGMVSIIAGLENTTTVFFQEIDQWGGLYTSGDAPTVAGGTSSVSGNQRNGKITVTGTALTSVTLTFAHPWNVAPDCTESDNQTASVGDISSISTTQVVFNFSVGVSSGTIWYICQAHQ